MSDAERVHARTDPRIVQERLAQTTRLESADTNSSAHIVDRFNGREHPELFFRFEIFDHLMRVAYSPETADAYRAAVASDVRSLGLPDDFWNRVGALAAPYLADEQRERELSTARMSLEGRRAELASVQRRKCADRARAIAAARATFGPDRFDRFLYEVVARDMFSISDTLPSPSGLAAAARGCE